MCALDIVNGIDNIISALPIKEVAVNAAGGFLGSALLVWIAFGWKGIKAIRNQFERPSIEIERPKAPMNIFRALEIGASAAWIQQQLGHPTKISDCWWGYRFSDALVSLDFDSNLALETVSLALTNDDSIFEFPSIHFECPPLGRAMLSDVFVEHLDVEHVSSLRHNELLIYGREGPTGAWHNITFGVLNPLTPGELLGSEFNWNGEENRLATPPELVKINWAAISSRSGPAHFPWTFGLNNQSF
jgi:hypothetical protein